MSYDFEVVAWQDWTAGPNNRHGGLPDRPQDAKGLKVVVTGEGETHQFWTYQLSPSQSFTKWSQWWILIGALMLRHGMPLEDEPSDDE